MEEVSTMIRPSLPGKSLIISGNGAVREAQQHQQTTTTTTRRDVLMVQAGSTDSGAGGTAGGLRQTVSILAIAPTSSQLPSETAGATVFVGAGGTVAPAKSTIANSPTNWRRTSVPEVQTVNGLETKQQQQQQLQSTPVLGQRHHHQHPQNQSPSQSNQSAQHVVKIRINPEVDTGRVISTVRLTADQEDNTTSVSHHRSSARLVFDKNTSLSDNDISGNEIFQIRRDDAERVSARNIVNERASAVESCVRISVVNGDTETVNNQQQNSLLQAQSIQSLKHSQRDEMVQQRSSTDSVNATSLNRNSGCFYYGSFQNPIGTIVMSSGQCSPSDTLDSGTCSDLDGTPPPLPKKKNSSTILLGVSGGDSGKGRVSAVTGVGQHQRTGSLTSSGAEVDSDDNESNISCDSLNSGELAARIADQQGIQVNGVTPISCVNDKSASQCQLLKKHSNIPDITNDKEAIIASDNNVAVCNELENINIKNNNNHTNNNNNSNNNNNNKSEDPINVNGKNSGEEEMNERNNGNGNVATGSTPEVISSSSSTRGTSPSVSPSPSGASSLSKASSTPRVRSPVTAALLSNGRVASPVVKECTYEERKREQDRIEEESAAADYYANYNRKNGTKYLYDDDRFYKFHINENQPDNDDDDNKGPGGDKESDEFFAGYKILDREAIRSAKGTVRGVKNRVRAGIATFLQKPSAKNYKAKDEGKIVVYTTSMGIVRETYFACFKMQQILNTHMVKYEIRDMFMSKEFQTELKERIGCETIEVPQLFIDGQYIGNADAVERLNECGELRCMLKPYKSLDACTTCVTCGGCRRLPCSVCNGSKKSPVRYDFLKEVYWLRCMNCDEVGLVPCQHC